MYAGDEYYTDDVTSGDGGDHEQLEPDCEHEGCECGLCGDVIEDEDQGESSPYGSVHTWCARKDEWKSPTMW